jgi:hypothetical protein
MYREKADKFWCLAEQIQAFELNNFIDVKTKYKYMWQNSDRFVGLESEFEDWYFWITFERLADLEIWVWIRVGLKVLHAWVVYQACIRKVYDVQIEKFCRLKRLFECKIYFSLIVYM